MIDAEPREETVLVPRKIHPIRHLSREHRLARTLLGVWLAAFFVTSAQAVAIDDFNLGSLSVEFNNAVAGDVDGVYTEYVTGVLAGYRSIAMTMQQIAGGNADAEAELNNGVLDVSSKRDAQILLRIIWDRNGTGLGGLDFSRGGVGSGFYLGFGNPIDNNLTVSFVVNGSSEQTKSFSDGFDGESLFAFSEFSDTGVFTTVDALELRVTSDFGADYQLDYVEVRLGAAQTSADEMPEPGILLLLAFGLFSFATLEYRKRTKRYLV